MCLDIERKVKLSWTNKPIVVNVNSLETFSSCDVVRCQHGLLKTDQAILVQVKSKKVFQGWQVHQVAVEPTVGFNESCRNRPPFPSPVWTIVCDKMCKMSNMLKNQMDSGSVCPKEAKTHFGIDSTILGRCWREKVVSEFLFRHPKCHFYNPKNGHFVQKCPF